MAHFHASGIASAVVVAIVAVVVVIVVVVGAFVVVVEAEVTPAAVLVMVLLLLLVMVVVVEAGQPTPLQKLPTLPKDVATVLPGHEVTHAPFKKNLLFLHTVHTSRSDELAR